MLERSWPILAQLAHFGAILEEFWRFLGPFMCILGSSWERLGLFWAHLGPSWDHLRLFGAILAETVFVYERSEGLPELL